MAREIECNMDLFIKTRIEQFRQGLGLLDTADEILKARPQGISMEVKYCGEAKPIIYPLDRTVFKAMRGALMGVCRDLFVAGKQEDVKRIVREVRGK